MVSSSSARMSLLRERRKKGLRCIQAEIRSRDISYFPGAPVVRLLYEHEEEFWECNEILNRPPAGGYRDPNPQAGRLFHHIH